MSDLQWATVMQASPLRVQIDGATSDGPALAPVGLTLAAKQRVLVEYVKPALVVVNRYT